MAINFFCFSEVVQRIELAADVVYINYDAAISFQQMNCHKFEFSTLVIVRNSSLPHSVISSER